LFFFMENVAARQQVNQSSGLSGPRRGAVLIHTRLACFKEGGIMDAKGEHDGRHENPASGH
jgi:hypothetical protein